MQGNQKDILRLNHILDSISEIEKYTLNINFDEFSNNSMMIDASIRHLEIIGEASNHLSEIIKSTYNTVEWRQIIGFRNLLIQLHHFLNIFRGRRAERKHRVVHLFQINFAFIFRFICAAQIVDFDRADVICRKLRRRHLSAFPFARRFAFFLKTFVHHKRNRFFFGHSGGVNFLVNDGGQVLRPRYNTYFG